MNRNRNISGLNPGGWPRPLGAVAATVGVLALALVNIAEGQMLMHGVRIGKVCDSPVCEAEPLNCRLVVGHSDGYGDTVAILEAFDVVDPSGSPDRVPAIGNLPISAVFGNTSCTVGGSLPCNIGAAASLLDDLPGDPLPGTVEFLQNQYIVQPGDPNPLANQANILVQDLCDSPTTLGCSSLFNIVQFVAATATTDCDDGDACTVDSCEAGECSHTPVICEEGDLCTTVTCVPATGCVYTPIVCDDGDPCTIDTCDEATGECVYVCSTPQITCPPDLVFECDAVGDFGQPVVNDPCSPMYEVECTEEILPRKLPQERTILRTCTVTNACGNTAACTQRIDVLDTTPPTVICPPDLTFDCDAVGDYGDPIVSDNCDPDPEVTITIVEIPGCGPTATAGITPPPKLTVERTVRVSDGTATMTADGGTGNEAECVQRIEIYDTEPPTLHGCTPEITVCAGADVLPFTPPTCTDTCGSCVVQCRRSDGVPLDGPAPFEPISIACSTTDDCHNVASPCVIPVTVESCEETIPTVSEWGLVVLTLLLLICAKLRFGIRTAEESA